MKQLKFKGESFNFLFIKIIKHSKEGSYGSGKPGKSWNIIAAQHFPGLESLGKRPLVLESSGKSVKLGQKI